ncbi:hypothetical protein XthCFBP4691_16450 [Xanthomonas theicola]|uniref:Microcin J25-processing protein McjB C-terminal domain-containing protein n=2 Tax=Xanthomonas theicola TaxID=56464 RepID=A0A2S6ZC40_9XANT|nr:hypothetical protein XthCFBP4691_16450 [Xanthomonas theicola]QNH27009.1 lasso peptide biosynthesis B2 protein [Xanthomonas theicola]
MESMAPPYFLSRQAYVCVANDVVFILDLTTGKYLSLDKGKAAGLGASIMGWPVESDGRAAPTVLRSLIDRGLVTNDPDSGKSATPSAIELPTHWIRESEPRGCPDIGVRELRRFMASVAYAALSKKFSPLKYTVARTHERKQAVQGSQADVGKLASLVRVFDWLRPLAFKKTNECFLYCLALSEFLSKYGIFPSWVFAVRADPFVAHCWLQYDDQVLTDIPFNLRRMVPILVL